MQDIVAARPHQEELEVSDFRQREPGDGEPASQATTAHLSYDSVNLYVTFVCGDAEPARIRAHLSRREGILDDDFVGVAIDTFGDRRRSYLFLANPLGIQADGITTEGQDTDFSFDTVWSSEGHLTRDGYLVRMAIPFKSLRFASGGRQTWGIALTRSIPRNSEQSYWPYITRRIAGLAPQFARVESLEGISRGRNVQLIPYTGFAHARLLDSGTAALANRTDRRAGLDAKVVLKDALSLDVTVNPDFSQVESDQPQATVNQRFEVFFPEKRPFFLENAGLFQYGAIVATRNIPEMLFFSRRIGDPQFGVRLTGKAGPWTVGALATDDRAVGRFLPSSDQRQDDRAAIGVTRIQREVGQQSAFGLFVTAHRFRDSSNLVFALDTRLQLTPRWVFTGQFAQSRTRALDGSANSGSATNANLNRAGRRFMYNVFYSDRSPTFHTELGFIPRTDIRQVEQYMEYRWYPAGSAVNAYGPNSYFRFNWDRRGRLQEWIVRFPFQIDLTAKTSIFVRRVESFELFRGLGFREHFQTINVTSQWLRWLGVSEGLEWGATPNFAPPPGVEPFLGRSLIGLLIVMVRPSPQVQLDATYLYTHLSTRDPARPANGSAGRSVFDNHIARAKLNYQFSRPLSARFIAQYEGLLPNAALVRLDRTKRLSLDALVTYLVSPGTSLYIGYLRGYENLAADLPDGTLVRTGGPSTLTNWQVFLKATYMLRF